MTGRGRADAAVPLVGAVAAGATLAALAAVRRWPPGGPQRWRRTNFRGRTVDLLGGPAAIAGAVATGVALAATGSPGALVVTATAGGLGLYDDLAGETHARGLRGHLLALREGRITTGLVKLAGLVAAGALATASPRRGRRRRLVEVAVDTALVSGTANLVNLLDLRPGRAAKAAALVAVPLLAVPAAAPAAAGALATAVVVLPGDLAERHMLGDGGANPLGALLGWALSAVPSRAVRAAALTVVVGLTLASERVSFSAVIDRTPALRAVDRLGRRP